MNKQEIKTLEKVENLFCEYEEKNGAIFTPLEASVINLVQNRLDEICKTTKQTACKI